MAQFDPDSHSHPPEEPSQSVDDLSSPSKWVPTTEAFEKLLASFSQDRDEAARSYELARSKLIRYFERRAIVSSERYADEALDRAMRRIDEGKTISNLMAYLYKIASNIVFEILKEQEMMRQAVNALPTSISSSTIDNDNDPRQDCFDECLERLREKERTLILDYYQEEGHAKIENHKEMAARMGIPLNALRIRVHRIRVRLETDVKRTWSSLAQRET
jgi:DNA-directed RNA polymerase specialized sigma24 family protein